MIDEIKIKNFKSINELTFEPGRVNVIIGENGCGKSNILEAITFGSAATGFEKLTGEFLTSRGIRMTDSKLMRSAFDERCSDQPVTLAFRTEDNLLYEINLLNDNSPYSDWKLKPHYYVPKPSIKAVSINNETIQIALETETTKEAENFSKIRSQIEHFLIYSPENHFIRKFEEEGQIRPLGSNGAGLFKLLKVTASESPEKIQEIKKLLELLDWFEDFNIPGDLAEQERVLRIKDRYLDETMSFFDQRSSNEGFLYLLFYFTLFISKYTPDFLPLITLMPH